MSAPPTEIAPARGRGLVQFTKDAPTMSIPALSPDPAKAELRIPVSEGFKYTEFPGSESEGKCKYMVPEVAAFVSVSTLDVYLICETHGTVFAVHIVSFPLGESAFVVEFGEDDDDKEYHLAVLEDGSYRYFDGSDPEPQGADDSGIHPLANSAPDRVCEAIARLFTDPYEEADDKAVAEPGALVEPTEDAYVREFILPRWDKTVPGATLATIMKSHATGLASMTKASLERFLTKHAPAPAPAPAAFARFEMGSLEELGLVVDDCMELWVRSRVAEILVPTSRVESRLKDPATPYLSGATFRAYLIEKHPDYLEEKELLNFAAHCTFGVDLIFSNSMEMVMFNNRQIVMKEVDLERREKRDRFDEMLAAYEGGTCETAKALKLSKFDPALTNRHMLADDANLSPAEVFAPGESVISQVLRSMAAADEASPSGAAK